MPQMSKGVVRVITVAIKTLDEFLATIPDDDNRSRMVDVPVSVGLTYPELERRRIA